MARIKGPRKVHRYSIEFKLKAVKLSDLAGVLVQGCGCDGHSPVHAVSVAQGSS
jgi:hypothetical protein